MKATNAFLHLLVLCLIQWDFVLGDKPWDELKFTQEWGFTACRQFKDKRAENKCRYENQPSFWSIHGIWPTQEGTSGPNFCRKVKFDITSLSPILANLTEYWYEIDGTKDAHNFWEHEWQKHGSCAMELDIFDSELKYFGEGLNLREKLDIYSILKSGGGIIPSPTHGYLIPDIHAAFQKALGSEKAVPYVQCLTTKDEATDATEYHILAIEICLDRQLQVLDCSARKHGLDLKQMYGDQVGPCPASVPVLYTDYTSTFQRGQKIKNLPQKKPYFTKHLPMSKRWWKLNSRHRGYIFSVPL